MREILFRGKRIDNGEWVEGYYTKKLCGEYINNQFMESEKDFIVTYFSSGGITSHEVIPESVGQYTGLTDKNGVKIFEGDIISAYNGRIKGPVIFDKRGLAFGVPNGPNEIYQFSMNFLESKDIKVIGNIHDNPELLGGDDT